jgi:hypothetical protein
MPTTEVRAFRDERGRVPLQIWLDELEQSEPLVYEKCLGLLLELEAKGNELRRPSSDALRDGIRELRTRVGKVHYRILYFFFGKCAACCSHGLMKEDEVPNKWINAAIEARRLVKLNADKYTADFEI